MTVRSALPAALLNLALGLLVLSLSSCALFGGERYIVPEEDTAAAQFAVASRQYREARSIADPDARREEMRKALLAYKAVEQRYPDDATYTPAASLFAGRLLFNMEDHRGAIEQFNRVLQKYPEQDDVRVEALYFTGQSFDALGRPQEAQPYYKQVVDQYSTASDPAFRNYAELARAEYREIRPVN